VLSKHYSILTKIVVFKFSKKKIPDEAKGRAMEIELDRDCKYCENRVKQRAAFKEENGKITVIAYLAKCPVCKRFLKKPTPEEIRRASMVKGSRWLTRVMNIERSAEMGDVENRFYGKKEETWINFGEGLEDFLNRVWRLHKERAELMRDIEEVEEEMERKAEELQSEVSTLKEQVMAFKETLSKMRTRKSRPRLPF